MTAPELPSQKAAWAASRARAVVMGTLWSLAGTALPSVVGIIVVPRLVHGYGANRFGILSLAFGVIGYFSLFDFGIGRAVTHDVADRLARGETDTIPVTVWTAWYFMFAVGLLGALLAVMVSPLVVARFVRPPVGLYDEASATFLLLGASIPVVVVTAGVRGVLEALQRFDLINVVRVPAGILTFVGPLAALWLTPSVYAAVWVLLIARIVTLAVYVGMCLHLMPGLRTLVQPSPQVLRRLAGFGAWMTVSNVLSPLMMIADRFVVSAVISVAAVTYYATPFDAVTRLLIIPGALAGVLFPTFASEGARNADAGSRMLVSSYRMIFLTLAPIVGALILFSPELLHFWLGGEFAKLSGSVLRWIAAGVLANGVAQIAFSYVQGRGRADLTAKVHMVEAPLYLVGLYVGVKNWGINGAAAVWCLRTTLDFLILYAVGGELVSRGRKLVLPFSKLALLGFSLAPLGAAFEQLELRVACFVVSLLLLALATYREPTTSVLIQRLRGGARTRTPLNLL